MSKFSERLHYLRKENEFSMEELCKILFDRYEYSTNKSMISKYEKEVHEPNFTFINYVAEIFGVTVDYMMGRKDDKYGEDVEYKKIPILGTIAAGIPIPSQEDLLGYEYILPTMHIDFCLKVKGDSMINARIFDGDIVFIKKQQEVENGEIAIVQIDGENATLKRFYNIDGSVILRAENPNYKDMIFSKKDMKEIQILGKAIFFKSEVK